MTNNLQTINISTSTILRVILILLGLAFLYLIRDVLVMIFVAVIIAAAVNRPANWLKQYGVPRILGVIFLYLLLFFVLALIVYLILPLLAEETKNLAAVFPEYAEKLGLSLDDWQKEGKIRGGSFESFLGQLGEKLTRAASGIFAATVGIFGSLASALIILVISFYLAVQEKGIKKFLMFLAPGKHQAYVLDLVERIQNKMGNWFGGQIVLALVIGVLIYIGLVFLGVKYALVLALLAGVLELVPYLGPIIAAVPAVILAFSQAPLLGLLVIILYFIIQQLENQVIAPLIMRKAVGLNPIIVIIAVLIGVKLAGIIGIILAVPVTAALAEFLKDVRSKEM